MILNSFRVEDKDECKSIKLRRCNVYLASLAKGRCRDEDVTEGFYKNHHSSRKSKICYGFWEP